MCGMKAATLGFEPTALGYPKVRSVLASSLSPVPQTEIGNESTERTEGCLIDYKSLDRLHPGRTSVDGRLGRLVRLWTSIHKLVYLHSLITLHGHTRRTPMCVWPPAETNRITSVMKSTVCLIRSLSGWVFVFLVDIICCHGNTLKKCFARRCLQFPSEQRLV